MKIFSGLYKGRTIQAPKGLKTRPTSGRLRESLFNICQGHTEGANFLDLFAGSGAMGFEALSRGAANAIFVDNSREGIRCIQENARALGIQQGIQIIYGDVFEVLKKLAKRTSAFDIIYADPPYADPKENQVSFSQRLLEEIDLQPVLLAAEGFLFLEDATGTLPQLESLKHLSLKSSRQMGRSSLQHYTKIL